MNDRRDAEQMPLLDMREALEHLSGKTQLYIHMLAVFRKEYADVDAHLEELLKEGDGAQAARLAHKLKGAAAHIGAGRLSGLAGELERRLAGHARHDDAARLLAQLKTALMASLEEIGRTAERLTQR